MFHVFTTNKRALYLQSRLCGGESGIRTHVTLSSKHAFQACAFSHSAISPARLLRWEAELRKPRIQHDGYEECGDFLLDSMVRGSETQPRGDAGKHRENLEAIQIKSKFQG